MLVVGQRNSTNANSNLINGKPNLTNGNSNPITANLNLTNANPNPINGKSNPINGKSNPINGKSNPINGNSNTIVGGSFTMVGRPLPMENRRFRGISVKTAHFRPFRADREPACPHPYRLAYSAAMNRLLFGDNLTWLRDKNVFPDACVDLVYLDPPFNSNANYNVLFKEATGEASQAQFHAFTDTWEWRREVDDTYRQFLDTCPNASVVELVEALKKFLKPSPTRRAMSFPAQTSPMMASVSLSGTEPMAFHRSELLNLSKL